MKSHGICSQKRYCPKGIGIPIINLRHSDDSLRFIMESLYQQDSVFLTHWGGVTHICVSKTAIIGSDNGLSPGRRQAVIWTNAGILLIGTLGTNFSEILIECLSFSFKKMHMKMSSGKWWPSCLGLNVLTNRCARYCRVCWLGSFIFHQSSSVSVTWILSYRDWNAIEVAILQQINHWDRNDILPQGVSHLL